VDSVRVASKGDQGDGDKRRGRGQEGPGLAAWDPAAWDGYLALGFLGKATKPYRKRTASGTSAFVADVSLALDVVLSWCGDYPGLERLYVQEATHSVGNWDPKR
jgi:hypothetical protein